MKHTCAEELETSTGILMGLMTYDVEENQYLSPDYVTLKSFDIGGVVLSRDKVVDLIGDIGVNWFEDKVLENWGMDAYV